MNILNNLLFVQWKLHHRCSIGLYIGLRKYWNFQSKAKLEQIIAIVKTHSIFLFSLFSNERNEYKLWHFFVNIAKKITIYLPTLTWILIASIDPVFIKQLTLRKKWSFALTISSVNVTKSAVSCGFGHIYWKY